MAGHVVIAPDKFQRLTDGRGGGDPALTTVACPVADGGDGTLGTVLAAGFERIPIYAKGPTGRVVQPTYGRSGETAVVEMAELFGLQRLPGRMPVPMTASSHRVGTMIVQASITAVATCTSAGCTRHRKRLIHSRRRCRQAAAGAGSMSHAAALVAAVSETLARRLGNNG